MSNIIAEKIGKPEQYVMVTMSGGPMMMSGKTDPAAFVDVRSIAIRPTTGASGRGEINACA